jgi:hypothetical protein
MPSTGFANGPFLLTAEGIDATATKTGPGAYALGKVDKDGSFIVKYVGRSDTDLDGRLYDWIGEYTHFKGSYYGSSKAAFEKECQLYHDFGGSKVLDNKVHPAKPANANWNCPVGNCDN